MGIDIKIDKDYKVTSNPLSVQLRERRESFNKETQQNEILWEAFAYYSDITSAIKGLMQHKIKVSDAKSIPELIEEIKRFDKKIERRLRFNEIQI